MQLFFMAELLEITIDSLISHLAGTIPYPYNNSQMKFQNKKQNKKRGMVFLLWVIVMITMIALFIFVTNSKRRSLLLGPGEEKNKKSIFTEEERRSENPSLYPEAGKTMKKKPVEDESSLTKVKKPESGESPVKTVIDYEKLKREIEQEIKQFPGTTSVIFCDLATGKKIEINPDEVYESASLVKLPIMVEIYNAIDRGKLKSDSKIELKDSYKVGGSGILKNKPAGSQWRIKQLTELMITQSDNTATDMLIDLVGMKAVEKTAKELGMTKTTLQRKIFAFEEIDRGRDNYTTPGDMLQLLKEIYGGEKLKREHCDEMLQMLKKQKRNSMLPLGLPKDAVCAHKTGSLLGILHDVGIVYPPKGNPYIIILMAKNVTNENHGKSVFADVSKKIYFTLNPR